MSAADPPKLALCPHCYCSLDISWSFQVNLCAPAVGSTLSVAPASSGNTHPPHCPHNSRTTLLLGHSNLPPMCRPKSVRKTTPPVASVTAPHLRPASSLHSVTSRLMLSLQLSFRLWRRSISPRNPTNHVVCHLHLCPRLRLHPHPLWNFC